MPGRETMSEKKILIIGAGPTGLGAAWRLRELGYKNWAVYEKNAHVGGLAASFVDEKGFTWDVGGHVLFSHYPYFDNLIERLLKDEYLEHLRESWIRIADRWVPYPFQNNIRYLPKEMVYNCLAGLMDCHRQGPPADDFRSWLGNTFGDGIVRYFMEPYNQKVWAYPLHEMSKDWIAERISVVDAKRVLRNVLFEMDDVSWGPNNKFRFPLTGGTGEIFRRIVPHIQDRLFLNDEAIAIDLKNKSVEFSTTGMVTYDFLINTMPLDIFVSLCRDSPDFIKEASKRLVHTSGLITGLGFQQKIDNNRCWMYFPEPNSPFYRVTNFSNYSSNNVPGGDTERYYSLMSEVSYSAHKPANRDQIATETIQGLISSGMIGKTDVQDIISQYVLDVPYSYPIPTLDRDWALQIIQPFLESNSVFSRGRFGGWKYEVGNMDHSTMQGVEIVNKLVLDEKESTYVLD
jgi:protoporphyrinogen oxidase